MCDVRAFSGMHGALDWRLVCAQYALVHSSVWMGMAAPRHELEEDVCASEYFLMLCASSRQSINIHAICANTSFRNDILNNEHVFLPLLRPTCAIYFARPPYGGQKME